MYAHITHYFKNISFPVTKHELHNEARENSAHQGILDTIDNMPSHIFATMSDVMRDYYNVRAPFRARY
jgi:hypothetical protein